MALTDNLVSYFRFDESSGHPNDAYNGGLLDNTNSVGYAAGYSGNAADFGTANTNKAFAKTSNFGIIGGAITLSMIVKMRTEIGSGEQTFINQESATNKNGYDITYAYNGGTRQLQFRRLKKGVSQNGVTHNLALGTSNFYHLVLTYDGSTITGYVNGVSVGTLSDSGAGTSGTTYDRMSVGAAYFDDTLQAFASIYADEVGIWSRALSAAEVSQLYSNGGVLQFTLLTKLNSYWKLDEASGTRADSVGSNTLTDNNTVSSAAGKISNAADFERSDSEWLSHADDPTLSTNGMSFTVCAWVKPESVGINQHILGKGWDDGAQQEYNMGINDSNTFRMEWYDGSPQVNINSGVTASAGNWYFVAIRYNYSQGNIRVRVNSTDSTPSSVNQNSSTGGVFGIGKGGSAAGAYFDGLVDEVGFWKRYLSDAELLRLYNSGAGLTYPFDAGRVARGFFAMVEKA